MRLVLIISLVLQSLALGGLAIADASCCGEGPMPASCACGGESELPAPTGCDAGASLQSALCGCTHDAPPATSNSTTTLAVERSNEKQDFGLAIVAYEFHVDFNLDYRDLRGSLRAPPLGGRAHNRQCALLGVWRA